MTNPIKNDTRLDPFTFPTETDGRFLLLVLMIAGMTLGLFLNLLYAYTRIESAFALLVIALAGVGLFFLWTWRQTKKSVNKEIEGAGWLPFPPPTPHLSEQKGLNNMQANIEQTVNCLPELQESASPRFIWDNNDRALSSRAFGYGQRQYILLPRGMYDAFVLQYKNYQAILLHELGHIANRDVSKTIFSIQLGRSFYKLVFVGLVLLFLYAAYFALRNFLTGGPVASIRQYFWTITETTIKLLLVLLLIEVIRSSVLRVREYYADARAAAWMNAADHLREQILAGNTIIAASSENVWHSLKRWIRSSVSPLHPKTERRLSMLNNSRGLFRPSLEVALLAGMLTGLTINGNFSFVSKLLPYIVTFSNDLADPLVQGAANSIMPYILSILLDVGTVLLVAAMFVIFGAFPVALTVGIQIQKASFADNVTTTEKHLASASKLFLIAFMLGVGTVAGFILTPFPEALSIGVLSFETQSQALTPFTLLSWTILYFLWLIPLRKLAGQLYRSPAGDQAPARKLKWLTTISILALLSPMLVMSLTQIVITSSIFLNGAVTDDLNKLFLIGLLIEAWLIAIFVTLFVWAGAWFVMKKRGWLKSNRGYPKADLSAWAVQSTPIILPNQPLFPPSLEVPPPL